MCWEQLQTTQGHRNKAAVKGKSRKTACLLDIKNILGLMTKNVLERKRKHYIVLHKAEGAVLGTGNWLALLVAMPALTHGTAVGVYLEAERTL